MLWWHVISCAWHRRAERRAGRLEPLTVKELCDHEDDLRSFVDVVNGMTDADVETVMMAGLRRLVEQHERAACEAPDCRYGADARSSLTEPTAQA